MSALSFRKIEKTDLEDVFVLLNQLKEKDVDSLDKDSSWKNFTSNTSANSIVGIYEDKIVAYGSIVIENKIRVSSKKVKNPEYVRYGWKNYFEATLFNNEGFPASSFRTP